jgi:hypothetical protein
VTSNRPTNPEGGLLDGVVVDRQQRSLATIRCRSVTTAIVGCVTLPSVSFRAQQFYHRPTTMFERAPVRVIVREFAARVAMRPG